MSFRIRKGLDIPIAGVPAQRIDAAAEVGSVALLGPDTKDLKPKMLVTVGERVKLGQPLYEDKSNPGVRFVSPGCGEVVAINRGDRRVLQSVVIELDGDDEASFDICSREELADVGRHRIKENLLASGLWTAFRTRPFSKIPAPGDSPAAIFVTAIDTNPLAADPAVVINEDSDAFVHGLQIVARLTDGTVHVCTAPDSDIPSPDYAPFRCSEFSGVHPAGLVGTHIHLLDPVGETKTVWHIGYQDVIAFGQLFRTGRLMTKRIIALAGPSVGNPRLVTTRLGANLSELTAGEFSGSAVRIVSGSVLNGHRAAGWGAYLGRYDNQVTVLPDGSPREFLSWMRPGFGRYSSLRAYAGKLFSREPYAMTTSQNGSPRAMVSIGSFEQVMPLDILPTPLLKAIIVRDTDTAKALGCLELDEEDLALCSFVCNGKYEYGPQLRKTLREIEVNG